MPTIGKRALQMMNTILLHNNFDERITFRLEGARKSDTIIIILLLYLHHWFTCVRCFHLLFFSLFARSLSLHSRRQQEHIYIIANENELLNADVCGVHGTWCKMYMRRLPIADCTQLGKRWYLCITEIIAINRADICVIVDTQRYTRNIEIDMQCKMVGMGKWKRSMPKWAWTFTILYCNVL